MWVQVSVKRAIQLLIIRAASVIRGGRSEEICSCDRSCHHNLTHHSAPAFIRPRLSSSSSTSLSSPLTTSSSHHCLLSEPLHYAMLYNAFSGSNAIAKLYRRGSLKSINICNIWGDTKCQAYLAPAFLELVHSPNQLFCIYIETYYP